MLLLLFPFFSVIKHPEVRHAVPSICSLSWRWGNNSYIFPSWVISYFTRPQKAYLETHQLLRTLWKAFLHGLITNPKTIPWMWCYMLQDKSFSALFLFIFCIVAFLFWCMYQATAVLSFGTDGGCHQKKKVSCFIAIKNSLFWQGFLFSKTS